MKNYGDLGQQAAEQQRKYGRRLERELAGFLDADELSVFSNGTLALQIACRLLRLSGKSSQRPSPFGHGKTRSRGIS
jgi:dTDP-4-amino-4,6-dideoxygalactose transaminase